MLAADQKLRKFFIEQLALYTGRPVKLTLPEDLLEIWVGLADANPLALDRARAGDFQNPLFWSGSILNPVINQWLASATAKQAKGKPEVSPIWPGGKRFAVCLTHDVDHVNLQSLLGKARYLRNRLRILPFGKTWLKTYVKGSASLLLGLLEELLQADETDFFSPWLKLEESYGFRSTFFFFPDRASQYHLNDGPWYEYRDRVMFAGQRLMVPELMQYVALKGWEVGLHGTFNSFADSHELKRQKTQVEKVVGKEILSIRQHCLHFDTLRTPRAQSQAGFKYDSTRGFNRLIGFRNGIAFPFYQYDLEAGEPLPMLQIPLHLQDGALLRADNLDLPPESALSHAKALIDKVEQYQGLVTLLWHPHVFVDHLYPGWFWVYQELLKYIAGKDAWVATVSEIGAWWEGRRERLGINF